MESLINVLNLKYLKVEYINNQNVVILVDNEGFEILKGYGNTITDAMNDLHQNLI
ncbi:hypothetical protein [Ulvibacter litoralis]|uniref:Uncharacterized protein n=1 Tax=Ulvibacter litoralis TaxID=227084 RepID=A0A1G7IHL6_9FLAO|nr:hypothetical protein [Ulvibacter litoralis]GHC60849.1 hypothetical protein GCM10008083_27360 [Ulvibacter litoralis]SDF12143.1 hypothetical protein SAMN05421855_10612 [Ulvibacter litoralis]